MKNIVTILFVIICQLGVSQNISQMRTFPINPTSSDTVLLIADLQFTSSGCELDTKSHSIGGNAIVASTQHCVGIAAAICNTTDTFVLGVLNSGRYTVNLSLSTGGGAAPCSPGIVPSDNDTMSFTVQTTLGIEDVVLPSYSVYPNPAKDYIELSDAYRPIVSELKVLTVSGAIVLESDNPRERIDVSKLAPGVYYLELYHSTGILTEKFIKE